MSGGKQAAMGQPTSVEVSLDAPGMTTLHRVGVAGLYLTLDELNKQPELATALRDIGGDWELTERSVTLRWTGDAAAFFRALIEASFKVDQHGLVWFTGLGLPTNHRAHAVALQEGLLNTFLQHGKTRKAGSLEVMASSDDDEVGEPPLQYRRFTSYNHQDAASDLSSPGKSVQLAGWNFPGGAVRHVAFTGPTALAEPLDRYLALLYAPVAAFFFRLRPRKLGLKPQSCLVLPAVEKLSRYARARRQFMAKEAGSYLAAGGAEASLRVAVLLASEALIEAHAIETLHVIEFGRVAWDNKQKYRLGIVDVSVAGPDELEPFRRVLRFLAPRVVQGTNGPFWSAPQTPELVAENVVGHRHWWRGFADFANDPERRQSVFGFERKGLAEMVRSGSGLDDPGADVFVRACHEAWRRRLGGLSERAKHEGTSFGDLVSREFESRRVSFARCKNAASLRAAVTDMWARAGTPLPALQDGWRDVLPYMNETGWQSGRDLALLALASYHGQSKEEQKALEGIAPGMGADDKEDA